MVLYFRGERYFTRITAYVLEVRSGVARSVIEHDALVSAARAAVTQIEIASVAAAFVTSLRTRRLEHWPTLASYAIARPLPEHSFEAGRDSRRCRVCGCVARLVAFESEHFANARAGGVVRNDSLRYVVYNLQTFASETIDLPNDSDREFFDRTISRIAAVQRDSKTFDAEKVLGVLLPSRIERKAVLGVLGMCGVLDAPDRRGFWPEYVDFDDRAYLDANPYTYPVTWWRREYGVKPGALHAFGLDVYLSPESLRAITF